MDDIRALQSALADLIDVAYGLDLMVQGEFGGEKTDLSAFKALIPRYEEYEAFATNALHYVIYMGGEGEVPKYREWINAGTPDTWRAFVDIKQDPHLVELTAGAQFYVSKNAAQSED